MCVLTTECEDGPSHRGQQKYLRDNLTLVSHVIHCHNREHVVRCFDNHGFRAPNLMKAAISQCLDLGTLP
jgi:hypothetical protein